MSVIIKITINHLMNAYHLPSSVHSNFYMLSIILTTLQGRLSLPHLQMRKLRLWEIKSLAQDNNNHYSLSNHAWLLVSKMIVMNSVWICRALHSLHGSSHTVPLLTSQNWYLYFLFRLSLCKTILRLQILKWIMNFLGLKYHPLLG